MFGKKMKGIVKSKKIFYMLLCVIITYIFYVFCTQGRIEKSGGYGWDGLYYNSIFQTFRGVKGTFIFEGKEEAYEHAFRYGSPFNQRIGVPYLASLLGFNEFLSFQIINLVSFFLGLFILFYKWFSEKKYLSIIFIFFILLTPQMPFRLTLFYPINVEGVLFLYIALVIYFRTNLLYILLFTILFLPFKEASLLIGGMYFITTILYCLFFYNKNSIIEKRRNKLIFSFFSLIILIIVYIIFKKILNYLGVETQGNSLKTIIFWVKNNGLKSDFPIKLLACIFTVFGGFWFFYFMKILRRKKITQELMFIVCLFPILVFSGSDITRILCVLLPFLLNSIIKLNLSNKDCLWLIACFILFLPMKFPFLILEFNDKQNIGEGFFITQFEYLSIKENILKLFYCIIILLFLYSPIFNKYILNNDKIFSFIKD